MSDASDLNRRRTAAWLDLDESEMSQSQIGGLLGVSQPTVSRATLIAKGEIDGPHTDHMNHAIDRYIKIRDERRAECERKRQEAAERAAAERSLREEESRRYRLWDWVYGELSSKEEEQVLRAYRRHHDPREPLTEDEELAILARHLERRPARPDPPVEITVKLPPRVVSPPADPKPVAQPQELPRETVVTPRQVASTPVRRNASPPRKAPTPTARPRHWVPSHSKKRFPVVKVVKAIGALLAVLAVASGIVMLASTDTARELRTTVSETFISWGTIGLILLSSACLIVPVSWGESAKFEMWLMKLSASFAMIVPLMVLCTFLFNSFDASYADQLLP